MSEDILKARQQLMKVLVEKVARGGCPPPIDIIDLRRGRLSEDRREQVETHVILCDSCAREYLILEELNKRNDEVALSLNVPMLGLCTSQNRILIDLDAPPYIPNGWSVVEHKQGGQMVWDSTKVKFHLSKNQKGGKRIEGNKLRKELEHKPVYNANLLDYLYANQELIPEEWKKNEDGSIRFTYFWGTIYSYSDGYLYVRVLYFHDGQWNWDYRWLGVDWNGRTPAAVPAS